MDFDKFQKNWHEAGNAMRPDDGSFDMRRRTSLERLARRYRMFSLVAFMAAGGPTMCMWLGSTHGGMEVPGWLILCFEAYFLICSVMDYWLYRGIRSIDCTSTTVEEVLHRSMFYRKRHLQFILVILPLAIGLLMTFGLYMKADMYMVYGMVAGALFGGAIGVRKFLDFMRDYRDVIG